MEKIGIGNTDLQVSRINLGGNVFGWTLDEKQSFSILDAFIDKGGNFIDTADVYSAWVSGNSGGESETIIGKWLKTKSKTEDIIVATKVGWDFGDGKRKGLSPSYIRRAVEDSLKRLQIDRIDLYYTHVDSEEIPMEEYLGVYSDLIKEGKIAHIAASNVPADRLKKSWELGKSGQYPLYQALQPHYNLVEREKYEQQYAHIAKDFNLTVFPYWSLAAGFLTGKYRSESDLNKSQRGESVRRYLNKEGLAILTQLDELSEKHHTTPAAVAIAWLLHRPQIGGTIASATNEKQLNTLIEASGLRLDKGDMEVLDTVSQY